MKTAKNPMSWILVAFIILIVGFGLYYALLSSTTSPIVDSLRALALKAGISTKDVGLGRIEQAKAFDAKISISPDAEIFCSGEKIGFGCSNSAYDVEKYFLDSCDWEITGKEKSTGFGISQTFDALSTPSVKVKLSAIIANPEGTTSKTDSAERAIRITPNCVTEPKQDGQKVSDISGAQDTHLLIPTTGANLGLGKIQGVRILVAGATLFSLSIAGKDILKDHSLNGELLISDKNAEGLSQALDSEYSGAKRENKCADNNCDVVLHWDVSEGQLTIKDVKIPYDVR